MKVWEMKEGKEYRAKDRNYKMRLHKGNYEYYQKELQEWRYSPGRINVLKELDFEEVVDTNSHWFPKPEEEYIYIDIDYDEIIEDVNCSKEFNGYEYVNQFHPDDKQKVECLALGFKIKSVLLNWRRLHDNVGLDWEDEEFKYAIINYKGKIRIDYNENLLADIFGYFSTREKAEQFYEYMKDDIRRYFEMRKELKF